MMAKKSDSTAPKRPAKAKIQSPASPPDDASRERFEQQHALFMSAFRDVCVAEKVPVALAVVLPQGFDPDKDVPILYGKGHIYDQAKLLARVLRFLKSQIDDELGG